MDKEYRFYDVEVKIRSYNTYKVMAKTWQEAEEIVLAAHQVHNFSNYLEEFDNDSFEVEVTDFEEIPKEINVQPYEWEKSSGIQDFVYNEACAFYEHDMWR